MKAGKKNACYGIKELKSGSSFGIKGTDAQERSLSEARGKGEGSTTNRTIQLLRKTGYDKGWLAPTRLKMAEYSTSSRPLASLYTIIHYNTLESK